VTLTESAQGAAEIIGHMSRRGGLYGNLPLRQVFKEVPRTPTGVVDGDNVISLLSQERFELGNQSIVIA
jgi:hypothetical protein